MPVSFNKHSDAQIIGTPLIRNPNDPEGMLSYYGDFVNGQTPISEWGNSVNKTLDDSISLSEAPAQNIASGLTLNGVVTMGANWDIGINSLLVNSGGVKTITAVSLAYLDGLDQTLKKADSPTFVGLTINALSGVLKGDTGDILGVGVSGTDLLPEATPTPTNLYHTNDRVDTLIQDATGITWDYLPGVPSLTPTLVNIELNQLLATTAGYIIATTSPLGVPAYFALTGDATITSTGVVSIVNDSHLHDTLYYTKDELDTYEASDFFEGEVSGKKQVDWSNVRNIQSTFTPEVHDMITTHNASIVSSGLVLRATGTSSFSFSQLQHGNLVGVNDTQPQKDIHHAEAHDIDSGDHTGDLAYTQVDGVVDASGIGDSNKITYAIHLHRGIQGSSLVDYSEIGSIPPSFPPSAHNHNIIMGWPADFLWFSGNGSAIVYRPAEGNYVQVTNSDSGADYVDFYLPNNSNGHQVRNIWFQIWYDDISFQDVTSAISYSEIKSDGSEGGKYQFGEIFHANPATQNKLENNTTDFTMTIGHQFFLRIYGDHNSQFRISYIYIEFENFMDG